MKITKSQLKRIIREEKARILNEDYASEEMRGHASDIVNMFLDEVADYVRADISGEQAPALAGMTMADFLQAAADRARAQNPTELVSDYGMK
tara:strand:- start:217 stop:492 length:276 start_codon:yes stop_codon:yes gene_type:complete